jgi:ATP-dependent helicase HrpA
VAALYRIKFAEKLKQLKKYTALGGEMKVWAAALGSVREVERSVAQRVSDDLFCRPFRTPGEFDAHAATIEREILPYGQKVLTSMMPVMKSAAETYEVLKDLMMKNRANLPVTDFLRATLDEFHRLVPANFIQLYSLERLTNIPRYLKALAIRAERGSLNLPAAKDKLRDTEVYTQKLQEFKEADNDSVSVEKREKIEELKWMIEEYKVSLFAQELKTPYPVSPKRLGQLIREIENIVY